MTCDACKEERNTAWFLVADTLGAKPSESLAGAAHRVIANPFSTALHAVKSGVSPRVRRAVARQIIRDGSWDSIFRAARMTGRFQGKVIP